MNRRTRARLIRGALNAATIGLSVILAAVAVLHFYFDDPVTRMPPRESIPADLPPKLAALIEKLFLGDEYECFHAIGEIGDFREKAAPAVPFLVPFLGNDRLPVKRPDPSFSLSYLESILWPPRVITYMDYIHSEGLATFSAQAGLALMKIGDPAVESLGAVMLRSRSALAREQAVAVLIGIGERKWEWVRKEPDDRIMELLAQALQQDAVPLSLIADDLLWSDAVLPPERLVELIRNARSEPHEEYRVRRLLRDPRGVLPMATARTDVDARIREIAETSLRHLAEATELPGEGFVQHEDYETVTPVPHGGFPLAGFVGLVKDPNPNVRCCAVYALGWWGEPGAVAPLVSALSDEDPHVRLRAAYWLARLGQGQGIEALAARIHDRDFSIRLVAVAALGRSGNDRAIEPLLEAEQAPFLRRAALNALHNFDRSPALARYIAALRDPSPAARSAAHRALVTITWEDFGEDADAWRAWWEKRRAEP